MITFLYSCVYSYSCTIADRKKVEAKPESRETKVRESVEDLFNLFGFCCLNYIVFIDNFNMVAVARLRNQNQVIVLP